MIKKGILKKAAGIAMACVIALSSGMCIDVNAEEGKYNMSYIYFGDSSSYVSHVEATRNSLNEISPNYFNVDQSGNLEVTIAVDIDFVREMHKRGVRVIPFLSNHWNRDKGKAALNNREKLAKDITQAIETYELDGINVDIENMTEVERNDYTDFVRLLNAALPADKTVAVAVAPNPFRINTGWQGSYDYASLAQYSDYLMVMAYDEHYQGGEAGSVAGLPFVENSIRYALESVPKEKIVLGIPFYGRYWQSGKSTGGFGISNSQVEEMIHKYNNIVKLDTVSQSPKAVITIKPGDEKPYVLGKRLEAGTYTVWYENEDSIKAKLNLVTRYGIKGTGSWSLGQETRETWDYYRLWLNGYDYWDAEGHWAVDYIISMLDRGWMKGTSDSTFAPNKILTRAEASTIIVRSLGLEGSTGGEVRFNDINNHWAKSEIEIAAKNDFILGKGDGRFCPDDPITRQEIAVLLDRVLGKLEDRGAATNPYKDISREKYPWSYNSIIKLTSYNIFNGGTDGTFKPLNKTTRAEMAALMDRVVPYMGLEIQWSN